MLVEMVLLCQGMKWPVTAWTRHLCIYMLKRCHQMYTLIHSICHLCFTVQLAAKVIPQAYLALNAHDQNETNPVFLGSDGYMVKDSARVTSTPLVWSLVKGSSDQGGEEDPELGLPTKLGKGSSQKEKMSPSPSQGQEELVRQIITNVPYTIKLSI